MTVGNVIVCEIVVILWCDEKLKAGVRLREQSPCFGGMRTHYETNSIRLS